MREWLVVLTAVATIAAAPLAAQPPTGGAGQRGRPGVAPDVRRDRRAAVRERLGKATPDARRSARDQRAALTAEQREALRNSAADGARPGRSAPTAAQTAFRQALRDKRQALRADVAAGRLDRRAAAEELRAWLKQNRPRPSGGEE